MCVNINFSNVFVYNWYYFFFYKMKKNKNKSSLLSTIESYFQYVGD